MKFLGMYVGNKTQNHLLLILCLVLAMLLIFLAVNRPESKEGFVQNERFLIRRQEDVYDAFYAQIYDKLFQPKTTNHYIFDSAERLTQPSLEKSVILDAGCGTGNLVSYMNKKGYKYAFGIDQSQEMIDVALELDPDIKVKVGDLSKPMTYDKHTFTHIFMTGNTLYHFTDKVSLFRNLYYWLIPNGYVILQLHDRDRFDPIPPVGKSALLGSLQTMVNERITDSEIDFIDFIFKTSYDFSEMSKNNTVLFQETFVDASTKNVRKNETVLYVESLNELVYMAQTAGFLVHGQFNLNDANQDPHQYVFILERPH
jgi:SAM-dependent methyltransferase